MEAEEKQVVSKPPRLRETFDGKANKGFWSIIQNLAFYHFYFGGFDFDD